MVETPISNVMTVDVEDYFHVQAFAGTGACAFALDRDLCNHTNE